ncbi:NAD(P)H-dependent oxidoreductase [Sphingomonas nostoxanthinifaciens]|uniref:NAD(P)H-dependent oxidoreductase n=1 Tax=Sphingomonas nostoxanthinifaciens TaxID=2872652 RepID=UPI001CC1DB31|nr:NAD(P)H-dependent oxidoreductase [Sphingomonas nostoxanthinifaciens]UAK23091.1 NAD(P)H-dependent oxidoreductase [Sphingomonas nostoxanthinifaciens]
MPHPPAFYSPRHVIVLAHPSRNSFNGLIADAYCDAVRSCGQEAIVRDLYGIGFDPVLKEHERPGRQSFVPSKDVEAEHDAIRGSDVFVMVYPIWFGMPPAMMKGYVDRVLGAGVTPQGVRDRTAMTLMKGQRLVNITSSGASKKWLNAQDQIESLRSVLGRYLLHAFQISDYQDIHFGETVEGLDQEYVDQNLRVVDDRARRICATITAERAAQASRGNDLPAHRAGK